eukprot:CAMPEP_0198122816 /NCGR_PEP_ID=MMETSP1442-20131203/35879_1 /TAXON_ID= /ORGANISM="Craspedostauros australis, Strain CCMP3328" /LENGTH=280 /DNA_ID=CAMNT_0043781903 /DNA_START=65 /DNA_END=907 /DNA_ORIENTATION=-
MNSQLRSTSMMGIAAIVLMASAMTSAFQTTSLAFSGRVSTSSSPMAGSIALYAKKKGKKRRASKGFSQEAPAPQKTKSDAASPAATTTTTPASGMQQQQQPTSAMSSQGTDFLTSVQGGSAEKPTIDPSLPVEERTKQILRKGYGLRTMEEQQEEKRRAEKAKEERKKLAQWKRMADKGEDFDIMTTVPPQLLIFIDRFLKIGLAICTVLFVSAGGAITVEAWSKATDSPLPENIDSFIVGIVEPNFTYGLLVLLGFSISLGAFAAAQLASAGSTYREDS